MNWVKTEIKNKLRKKKYKVQYKSFILLLVLNENKTKSC